MLAKEIQPSHLLSQIYLARALDPVIEVARAVAEDFVKRTHFYTHVPDDIAGLLANFHSLTGKHPEWPNISQRAFTSSKAVSRFCQGFADIMFIQRVSSPGELIVRNSFIESAVLLQASVQPLEGTGLSAVELANSGMLKRAMIVLSSNHVSAAFGVAEIPTGDWPHGGLFCPQLGYLCERVSQTLALDRPVLQPTLSILQRAAHYGSITIAGVLDPSFTEAQSERTPYIIQSASAWAAALNELLARIDIARAWKEPAYRSSLYSLEKDIMPPHPSGEINLEGTIRTASPRFPSEELPYSTQTVADEICCSTGDLNCEPEPDLPYSTQTTADEICCSTGDLSCPANTNGHCDISDDCPTLTSILT